MVKKITEVKIGWGHWIFGFILALIGSWWWGVIYIGFIFLIKALEIQELRTIDLEKQVKKLKKK